MREWLPGALVVCMIDVPPRYQAAEVLGYDFKLFISLDMSSFPCSSAANATVLRQYVANYSSHPHQLRWNGAVFISTFSGSDCTFGRNSSAEG